MAALSEKRPFPSSLWRLRVMLRKELLNLIGHPYYLIGLVLPVFMSIVFAVILPSRDDIDRIQVVVYDPEQSALVTALADQPAVELLPVASEGQVRVEMRALGEDVTAGLIVPAGLDAAVAQGAVPTLMIYLNEEARSTNQARFQRYISEQIWALRGEAPPVAVVWNPINETGGGLAISLENYLFLSMTLLGLTLVATIIPQSLIEEKDTGALQPLLASPVTMNDLLLAKALLAVVYGLVVLLAMAAFHDGWTGNWLVTAVAMLLTLLMLIAMGLLLGIYGKSKAQNNMLVTVLTLAANIPSWFAIVSVSSLPAVAAFLLRLLPTHYTVRIVTLSLEGNATLANTAVSFIILSVVTLVLWGWLFWKVQDRAVISQLITMES